MKKIEQKINETTEELRNVNNQLTSNSTKQEGVYSALEEMYDEGGYSVDEYSSLQATKEVLIKEGSKLYKKQESLIKKLTKLFKRSKIEPADDIKHLLS